MGNYNDILETDKEKNDKKEKNEEKNRDEKSENEKNSIQKKSKKKKITKNLSSKSSNSNFEKYINKQDYVLKFNPNKIKKLYLRPIGKSDDKISLAQLFKYPKSKHEKPIPITKLEKKKTKYKPIFLYPYEHKKTCKLIHDYLTPQCNCRSDLCDLTEQRKNILTKLINYSKYEDYISQLKRRYQRLENTNSMILDILREKYFDDQKLLSPSNNDNLYKIIFPPLFERRINKKNNSMFEDNFTNINNLGNDTNISFPFLNVNKNNIIPQKINEVQYNNNSISIINACSPKVKKESFSILMNTPSSKKKKKNKKQINYKLNKSELKQSKSLNPKKHTNLSFIQDINANKTGMSSPQKAIKFNNNLCNLNHLKNKDNINNNQKIIEQNSPISNE